MHRSRPRVRAATPPKSRHPDEHRRGGRGDRLRMGSKHLWDGFLLGESAVKLVAGLDGYVKGGRPTSPSSPTRATGATDPAGSPGRSALPPGKRSPTPWSGGGSPARWSDWSTASKRVTSKCGANFYKSGREPGPAQDVGQHDAFHRSSPMLMKEFDFHGPTMSVSAMCASANAAMITAKSWLDSGHRVRRDPARHRSVRHPPAPPRPSATWALASSSTPAFEAVVHSRRAAGALSAAKPRWPWCSPNSAAGFLCLGARRGHDHGRLPTSAALAPDLAEIFAASGWPWPMPASIPTTSPISTPMDREPPSAMPPR